MDGASVRFGFPGIDELTLEASVDKMMGATTPVPKPIKKNVKQKIRLLWMLPRFPILGKTLFLRRKIVCYSFLHLTVSCAKQLTQDTTEWQEFQRKKQIVISSLQILLRNVSMFFRCYDFIVNFIVYVRTCYEPLKNRYFLGMQVNFIA